MRLILILMLVTLTSVVKAVTLHNNPKPDIFGSRIKSTTTAEHTLKPHIFRVKRSSNVIEEENVGSTVSGYKFTWLDTRLTDNLVYKNIH